MKYDHYKIGEEYIESKISDTIGREILKISRISIKIVVFSTIMCFNRKKFLCSEIYSLLAKNQTEKR